MIMTGATELEIGEATRHWFAFLRLLADIAFESDQQKRDSRGPSGYVSISGEEQPNV